MIYFPKETGKAELDVSVLNPNDPHTIESFTANGATIGDPISAYDIRLVNPINGKTVQPSGHTVTIQIPIPEDIVKQYDAEKYSYTITHALNNNTVETFSTTQKKNTKTARLWKDEATGTWYLLFDVSSFSPFLVCVEKNDPAVSIRNNPGTTTLTYGTTLILTAEPKNLPMDARIIWITDSDRVTIKPSENGTTCEVIAKKSGTATVTVTVIDAEGNPICVNGKEIMDSQTIHSKASFFHKLFAFFRRLFGIQIRKEQEIANSPIEH